MRSLTSLWALEPSKHREDLQEEEAIFLKLGGVVYSEISQVKHRSSTPRRRHKWFLRSFYSIQYTQIIVLTTLGDQNQMCNCKHYMTQFCWMFVKQRCFYFLSFPSDIAVPSLVTCSEINLEKLHISAAHYEISSVYTADIHLVIRISFCK